MQTSAGDQLLIGSLLAPETSWRDVPLSKGTLLRPDHVWQWNRAGTALSVPYYCWGAIMFKGTDGVFCYAYAEEAICCW